MSFAEIKQKAKGALDFVQNNPVLDTSTRGLMESFPAGQILLKFYDKYSEVNTEDAASDIENSLKLITKLNEEQLYNFTETLTDNTSEILENRKLLTILTNSTAKMLGLLEEIKGTLEDHTKDLDKIKEGHAKTHEGLTRIENLLSVYLQNVPVTIIPDLKLELTESNEKIQQIEYKLKQNEEIQKRQGKTPAIDIELALKRSAYHYYQKEYREALALIETILDVNSQNVIALNNNGVLLNELEKI